jgi:hypothetical protein
VCPHPPSCLHYSVNRLFIQHLAPFPFYLLSLLFIIRLFLSTTTFIFKARRSGSVHIHFYITLIHSKRSHLIHNLFTIQSQQSIASRSAIKTFRFTVSIKINGISYRTRQSFEKISNCRNYEVQQQRRSRSTIPLQRSCAATQGTSHASEAP